MVRVEEIQSTKTNGDTISGDLVTAADCKDHGLPANKQQRNHKIIKRRCNGGEHFIYNPENKFCVHSCGKRYSCKNGQLAKEAPRFPGSEQEKGGSQ